MKHYWLDLPGPVWFSGADVYRRYAATVDGPSVAVELGAWKGRSTACMGVEIANSSKPIDFYTVDHWQGSRGEPENDSDPDRQAGRLFDVFQKNIAPVAANIKIIRSDSAAAAEQFCDESINFLYIDASHTYAGVMRDLIAWFPKVKPGGVIAGDDWCSCFGGEFGVRNAVRDFLGSAASTITIEPGSPNAKWLQWSLVKTPELRIASRVRRRLKRAMRSAQRSLPLRAVRGAFQWLRGL